MSAKVHVLHVVPGLKPGGMEFGMAKVISGLNGKNMRHSIACLNSDSEITNRLPKSTEIHYLHSYPNELKLPVRLAQLFRKVQPTVIHARNWGAWPDTAVGRLLGGPRIPLILSFHGLGKAGYMPRRRRLASWILARMATHLFTVSNQSRELMVTKWGWPDQKVEVISNGVDTDCFQPAIGSRSGAPIVVGTVGNLRPVKNHALLVEACGELVRRGVDLELRIAGVGKLRDYLLTLAREIGLGDRLKLYGLVEEIPDFLQDLDVFVLSSDSEQHPNALNEAMACGLACVATRVGCVNELLDEGRCGKIVSPGDRVGMAAAIRELVEAPTTRQHYGALAKCQARDHYSLNQMLAAYDALYRGCSGHKDPVS